MNNGPLISLPCKILGSDVAIYMTSDTQRISRIQLAAVDSHIARAFMV